MFTGYLSLCLSLSSHSQTSEGKELESLKDEQVDRNHSLDSLSFLILIALLIAHVVTVWLFVLKRIWYVHPTGLALFYGEFT